MQLKRFRAAGVHGYLNFDIKFFSKLTFITGINGSGKTTALNAIQALLAPDLNTLVNLRYDYIEVEATNEGKHFSIRSQRADKDTELTTSDSDQVFSITRYGPDPELPAYRQIDAEQDHYRDLASINSENPVLKVIADLPTPMFLGIDRRTRFEAESRRPRIPPSLRANRVGRNLFGSSLSLSLADAAELIATRFRDALIASGRIGDELQRELLLNLITLSADSLGQLSVPQEKEVEGLRKLRKSLDDLARIFKLPRPELQRRIDPFLRKLERAAAAIPPGVDFTQIFRSDNLDRKIADGFLTWNANRSQLDKIAVMSRIVASYNDRRTEIMKPVNDYIKLINDFLVDSGKYIEFNEDGFPHVKLQDTPGETDIASLSSGEGQVFVILSQLSFNRLARNANVFIIDEPELSLHVRWQELFVDSIIAANPDVQYILATHSPSIILDRLKSCVDLNARRRRARVG